MNVGGTAADRPTPESAWLRFRRDTSASARVLVQQPALPILTLLIWLPIAALPVSWGVLVVPLDAFALGFFGMQREWYAKAFAGGRPTPRRIWTGSWRYFLRLLPIAIVFVLLPVFVVSVVLPVLFRLSPAHNFHGDVLRVELAFVALSFLLDLLLTFVMPALVFTTANTFVAVRIGWRYLRRCWQTVKWHALVPPMTIIAIGRLTAGLRHGIIVGVTISLLGALLNLLFKGAQLRAYFDHAAELEVPIAEPPRRNASRRRDGRPSRRDRAEAERDYENRIRW